MSNYKKLRDVLRMHRKHFYDMLNENDEKISTYNKLKSTLEAIDYSDVFNVDYMKLIRLKRYFPDQKEEMETLLKLENYKDLIDEGNARNFNFEEYDKLITYSSKKFGVGVTQPALIVCEVDIEHLSVLDLRKLSDYFLYQKIRLLCILRRYYRLAPVS